MKKIFKFLLIFTLGYNSNLTAQCPAVPSPYTENFGSANLPSCWQQSAISGDGWRFTGNPGYAAANNGRPSGTFAWIDFSGTDAGTVMEVVPVDISNTTNPQVEFDYYCYNTTNPIPPNLLFVEANDGVNWVLIDSLSFNSLQISSNSSSLSKAAIITAPCAGAGIIQSNLICFSFSGNKLSLFNPAAAKIAPSQSLSSNFCKRVLTLPLKPVIV